MAVEYNTVSRPNPKNPRAPRKYYPSVKASGRTNLRKLANLIDERSTFSSSDTLGVIDALLKVIPSELKEGKIVELGEFGSFWLRNTAVGVDSEDQVSAGQVTNLLVRFIPGQAFKEALKGARLVKARRRT